MDSKKFVVDCQENLQRIIDSVGAKSEENVRFQNLLSELIQICDDNSHFGLTSKAILLARDNKFVEANFCYRVFLQGRKFNELRSIDRYLKCVFLASNANNIHYSFEMIFLTISQLEKFVIDKSEFESVLNIDYIYQYSDLHKLTHKIKFGDYAGILVSELLRRNPSYLLWCVINIDNFLLDNGILTYKGFLKNKLYAKAVTVNLLKNSIAGYWESSLEDEADGELEITRNYKWEQETFDALTDGHLGDWEEFNGDIDDARTSMGHD